ncbi:16S rRNA (cytosine(1402)-N(4))-methyltransferase [Moraxella caviae]|uniref:Ribosomal RNA small subunit methyltransferase H n=1 Tax=Moraxella caviae TaxID=34060 RepID=A0A1T0A1D7_9GAMM|nr:16S rRNA (cytosine(1402)-N(4))-methyltransferase RsmH [Moraxella caviae]OOR89596.1 16S rRNA (cytosine(1402)-N(4))-methyltransferase [Moraxella caviae]STZ10280.1 Ribosomal RNA small subunit methyltransferase H [Moraxella caviae]
MTETTATQFTHLTVLLQETVACVLGVASLDLLAKRSVSGVYVDATFGRGGHSRLLLEYLSDDARLIVFDKDPEAIMCAKALADTDARVSVVHDSFAALQTQLLAMGIDKVDGVLADLGVSSPQLDDGARGFSFMRDGAVDMRMDTTRGEPVSAWLAKVDVDTLADVLYEYGEERHSRRIARAIKAMESYDSTLALADVIKAAHPAWQKGKHPATQSFQALRIFINNELGDVDEFLRQSLSVLVAGGHLAVISFHSLEDRRIKRFFNDHSKGRWEGDEALIMPPKRAKYFGKPVRIAPSAAEVSANPRARSAWLRGAKRSDVPLA